jgi:thymidylate kinase
MLSKKSKRSQFLIIAIEGPDYSGKSTIAEKIVSDFNAQYPTSTKINQFAIHLRRPGGSYACDDLREKITNTRMPSDTRQVLAFAEEILLNYTVPPFHKLFVYDRFNPISGQVYGPDHTHFHWRWLVESGIIVIPDLVIFIDTPKEILLERYNRVKRDVMDTYFMSNVSKILENYDRIKADAWFNEHFNHASISNTSTLDDLQSSIATLINKELKDKNV